MAYCGCGSHAPVNSGGTVVASSIPSPCSGMTQTLPSVDRVRPCDFTPGTES